MTIFIVDEKMRLMNKKILLTSFQTWLPHQVSNAADDLLIPIQESSFSAGDLIFLRQLPVQVSQASQQVIAMIEQLQPDGVICCGMAESRQQLTLESNATWQERLYTSVNLEELVAKLAHTQISHNAGKFVCEGLYYHVLTYLKEFRPQSQGLFVHVPLLHGNNFSNVLADFRKLLTEII